MGELKIRTLLIGRSEDRWMQPCERALHAVGIGTAEAYNCWSGNDVLGKHAIEMVIMDSHVMCEAVSKERPYPILSRSPEIRVLVVNAEDLSDQQKDAALGHEAVLLQGARDSEIARVAQKMLGEQDPEIGAKRGARTMSEAGRTVLVATTSDRTQKSLENLLQKAGYQVATAYNAYSAEYVLEHRDIDLVVIDGKIVGSDPPSRPRAILEGYPGFRFVIFNAESLPDAMAQDFSVSGRGSLIKGDDSSAVVQASREQLTD